MRGDFVYTDRTSLSVKVTVKVIEQLLGQWKICEESSAHNKISSSRALWRINIPPKGKKFLIYRVEIRC
jgi:hypothetical protein